MHSPRISSNVIFPLSQRGGFALVIVLSCLLFITALIVTFLVSMRTEVASSKASADSTQARQLGDMAVNIAIAQIREATLTAGSQKLAWASQPGMIRLYDSQGQPAGYRKLYSWGNMVGEGAFNPFADDEKVEDGWASNSAIYTDLNAPIRANSELVYPILDKKGASDLGVEGFNVATAPGMTGEQPAPMPVKWLYVLADGSLHLPSGSGEIASISEASSANPIVGRIAFWTDDDTCKVNINTASEGYFWSTPRFDAPDERNLSTFQPARGEFQSYPGHPASVSLRSVFSKLTDVDIFKMAPRLEYGGSKGGTTTVVDVAETMPRDQDRLYASVEEFIFTAPTSSGGAADRTLLQSKLKRTEVSASKFFLTAHSRAPELNLFGLPRLLSWPIHNINDNNYRTINDRLLAFCSTLGGKSFYFTRQENMSPTDDLTNIPRNIELLDYLDALTGRNVPGFGGNFRGKYTQSEMRQILTEIFDYIRCTNLTDLTTPVTPDGEKNVFGPYAFGLSPRQSSYLVRGKRDGGRSSGLGQAMPIRYDAWDTMGFGGRYLQVSEAHLQIVGVGRGEIVGTTPESYQPPVPVYDGINDTIRNNDKIVGTYVDGGVKKSRYSRQEGNRRWTDMYPDEASIQSALDAGNIDYKKVPYNFEGNNIPPPKKLAIQSYFLLSTLVPSEGIEYWVPGQWIEVSGLEKFAVRLEADGPMVSMGFPSTATMTIMGNMLGGGGVGGARVHALNAYGFVVAQNQPKLLDPSYLGSTDERRNFPLYSDILPLDMDLSQLQFQGGAVTVRIFADKKWPNPEPFKKGELIQEYVINFPDAIFPVPKLANMRRIGTGAVYDKDANPPEPADDKGNSVPSKDHHDRWGVHNTIVGNWLIDLARNPDGTLAGFNDVFKSVPLKKGDIRLLAQAHSNADAFEAQNDYFDVTKRVVYGSPGAITIKEGSNSIPPGIYSIKRGKLVANAAYRENDARAPFVPAHINGAMTSTGAPGDWDNGTSVVGDGPYINAADPGSVSPEENKQAYFDNSNSTSSFKPRFFSPNRQMPSPVMFGSLSTGVKRGLPWQTLLFRPGHPDHPGVQSPKDHLLLDLFWMPVVEPYAISEPFSTAGKINMNQQLVPFTYIQRMTGLHAAMKNEQVAVMEFSRAGSYKHGAGTAADSRQPLNMSMVDGTLRQFKEKFDSGQIFRSASEICDIYLVPKSEAWSTDAVANTTWYNMTNTGKFSMVGDNTRERPYAHVYNKLTTKSNTYTVHYHVQNIAIPKNENQTQFNPATGSKVTSDLRGSSTIERYIDPNDPRFLAGSGAANSTAVNFLAEPGVRATSSPDFSFEPFYRFHVLQSSTFAP